MNHKVNVSLEKRNIPTYEPGKPEINPVFFEKRVYQGSSGKVYPVPFIDKIYDHKTDKLYDAATLENEYVKLVILPEIGGRIFEAKDKTNNNYDFFYRQEVIKPALVGLAGPWISGGVEFNWPQHHRPGTYLPTDTFIEYEPDGAVTFWMSEYDPMYRLKGMHGIRLRPGSSLIELRGRLYNPTPLTHTFLWWANVAVEVHRDYRSFFPPDVHYVADHAVRAMSSFPLAENDYYGIPYHSRPGKNDLRNYANIPVPTSYMVCDTRFDFFGGYDFRAEGGFIHVANRHIAPGKKQWTWGNDNFGRAWDRELTDTGGPYFELMAGVYTDNQPDFTYLLPYETKTFSQFWWSYKKLGPVQNANKDLALRFEIMQGNRLDLGVAASRKMNNLRVILRTGDRETDIGRISVSPRNPWHDKTHVLEQGMEHRVSLIVYDKNGNEQIAYHHREVSKQRTRKVAVEPKHPADIKSPGELELIGEHLELYRHPTRYPEPYWKEAIIRDPKNYKSWIALGRLALKNGNFDSADKYLKTAVDVLTQFHPNPSTGEAHYFCGIAGLFRNKPEEAYAFFYKATWNFEWRSAAYYQIALLDCQNRNYKSATEHAEASLDTNRQNNKAHVLKAILLKRSGKPELARQALVELLKTDPLDQWALYELGILNRNTDEFIRNSRNDAQTIIDIAFDYTAAGCYEEAIGLLQLHHHSGIPDCAVPNPMGKSTMTRFILAWLYELSGDLVASETELGKLDAKSYDYLFPSRLHEQTVLEWAMTKENCKKVAAYGLGNYYFNLKRHEDAIKTWETAAENQCDYATLCRNLGIAYWNKPTDGFKAREMFKKALELSPDDMRIWFEYDQLRKKINDSPQERLVALEQIREKVVTRDDFSVELAALYNFNGDYRKALDLLECRNFHPWEGGEGQALKQYSYACIQLGRQALTGNKARLALDLFVKALDIPENLGEKYHPLQSVSNINYWKGMAYKALGNLTEAKKCFLSSKNENGDFIDMAVSAFSELSYYRALSMTELGFTKEAKEIFQQIKQYGVAKLAQKVQIDYFATSLPLLLVFEDDLQLRNTIEAKFIIALAEKGLGNDANSKKIAQEVLSLNKMHTGARDLLAQPE